MIRLDKNCGCSAFKPRTIFIHNLVVVVCGACGARLLDFEVVGCGQ